MNKKEQIYLLTLFWDLIDDKDVDTRYIAVYYDIEHDIISPVDRRFIKQVNNERYVYLGEY